MNQDFTNLLVAMKEKASGSETIASVWFLTMLPKSKLIYLFRTIHILNITHRPLDQLNYAPYEMMAVTHGKLEPTPRREQLFPLQQEDHVL